MTTKIEMKIIIIGMILFFGCDGTKKCEYDVYQHGVLIDKVIFKEFKCRSKRASSFSDMYYRHVK